MTADPKLLSTDRLMAKLLIMRAYSHTLTGNVHDVIIKLIILPQKVMYT